MSLVSLWLAEAAGQGETEGENGDGDEILYGKTWVGWV